MVGLADLKKYTDNIKRCQMTVNDKYCYFQLTGLNIYDFLEILNYKSWIYKTFQKSVSIRYVNVIKKLDKGNATFRTSVGFAPLLLRFLRSKWFKIREEDIEAFRARNVVFPDLKINLYDFQNRMIKEWFDAGSIGVIKSPTGSGKTIIGCYIIKNIGRKTLILVHTGDLLINVWNDSLIKSFGPGIMSQVGIIGGGLTDADRMVMKIGVRSGDFSENIKKDIVIATFQTFVNHIDELSDYKFGLMIVDECIPIDSEIWTKDGIVKYEDLSWDNGIYQVWSRDDDNNLVNNGYKKIKTRYKHMYKTIVETGDELVCSLDHKVLSRLNDGRLEYIEIGKAKNIARSLVRPYGTRKECILARIFGYMLGGGSVSFSDDGFQGRVFGDRVDLERISYDIKKLHHFFYTGDSGKISEIHSDSVINTVLYGEKKVSGIGYEMAISRSLADKLVSLGYPVGKKTNQSYLIPEWIMKGDKDVKREFLSAYMGAEATNPSFRGNEDNKLKKSFYVPRFSINKREDLVEEGLKIIEQFRELFKEFDINISNVGVTYSNIRKDGTISKEIRVTIGNEFDNLRRFLDIGYRHCLEKEKEGEIIKLYLDYVAECDKDRKDICSLIFDLYNRGKPRREIVSHINNIRSPGQNDILSAFGIDIDDGIKQIIKKKYLIRITEGIVSDTLYPHKRDDGSGKIAESAKGVISFDEWENKVKGDFIFLDILRHAYRGYEQGYTLTVGRDHNYLVNGFVKNNCHHVPAQIFRKVNAAIRAPYKLGLSATMKRLDGLEKDIYGSLGDVQSSVSIRELINKGILAEPRFQSPVIVDNDVIQAIENCGQYGLAFGRFVKKASASSQKKKDYIIDICKNVAGRDRKFLLFCDYVNAEDVFVRDSYANSLLAEGVKVSIIDQEMSSDERSKVFNYLDTGDLSGIVFGKLGSEGVNIPSVDVVIMANAIKCISGDIPIPTDRGMIRTEDLDNVKPSIVSTMDLENGSMVRANINELYSFDEEDTIRIITNNGYEIEGSLGHMIVVRDQKDNLIYKSLSDVRVDDDVVICGSNIYGKDIDLNYTHDGIHHLDNVPWYILRAGKNIQLAFLRSLFAEDGGITDRNNIVYSSKSKRLCDDIHIMLLNMGTISKKCSNGRSWYVLITGAEAGKFMRDIGFSDDRKFEYNIDMHNHNRGTVSHYADGNVVFFDSVAYKVRGKNKLYDMNVDRYHSFIAGGFVNHNSPITFTQRVGRVMRKVPGKEFADVYEILIDTPTEHKWSDFNFAEYKMEGFQKLVYRVE